MQLKGEKEGLPWAHGKEGVAASDGSESLDRRLLPPRQVRKQERLGWEGGRL